MLKAQVALVSVFLCAAVSTRAVDRRCLRELPLQISQIWKSAPVQRRTDGALYTPTTENYTNCPGATLRCFAAEMKVLMKEWEITNVRLSLSNALNKTSRRFQQPDSDCLHCELLQEENGQTFLERLTEVVQMMNSQFCKKAAPSKRRRRG
uniref:Interleukin n=1 Tax=Salarias fasciatus TaxID=181472 RepID=A0A672H760_SALFA